MNEEEEILDDSLLDDEDAFDDEDATDADFEEEEGEAY